MTQLRRTSLRSPLACVSGLVGLLALASGCSSSAQSADGSLATGTPAVSGDRGTTAPSDGTGKGSGGTSSGTDTGGSTPSGAPIAGPSGAMGSGGSTGGTGVASDAGVATEPGTLTAGVWDDNLNFDFYKAYVAAKEVAALPGRPLIKIADRLQITVSDAAGRGVAGAAVKVLAGGTSAFESITGADGRALFFPSWASVDAGTALTIQATAGGVTTSANATAGDANASVKTFASAAALTALDVVVMVDTTGSMGDEIAYLQKEVDAISSAVATDFPGVDQRWALVDYKDTVDPYTVKTSDFHSDLSAFQADVNSMSASGGGDFPESPEVAMAKTVTLSWRGGATARVVFWIADAPHHVGTEQTFVSAFAEARRLGIHVYPISASGTDDLLEYTMRQSAALTGGRYMFLTNDSGVGGDHKEPEIPCYYVTKLNSAMTRMLHLELTGTYVEPTPAEVIRTGGDVKLGMCSLTAGGQVSAF